MIFRSDGYSAGPSLTAEMIAAAEEKLGYKLPQSYLDILREQNGGYLARPVFPTHYRTNWADDHVYCSDLQSIGGKNGIDSPTGSAYLIREWGYPMIGVVISSEGHTAFMLDYRACGSQGEPGVVYVDTEPNLQVFPLTASFTEFIASLIEEQDDDEDGVYESVR